MALNVETENATVMALNAEIENDDGFDHRNWKW